MSIKRVNQKEGVNIETAKASKQPNYNSTWGIEDNYELSEGWSHRIRRLSWIRRSNELSVPLMVTKFSRNASWPDLDRNMVQRWQKTCSLSFGPLYYFPNVLCSGQLDYGMFSDSKSHGSQET